MNRRKFISVSSILTAAGMTFDIISAKSATDPNKAYVMTVLGKLNINEMGITLPHEHVLTDFIEVDKQLGPRYEREIAFEAMIPLLMSIKNIGVRTFVDCTPAYIGRDVLLLKQLSKASGLNILTNTGYYAAADEKHLPDHAYTETKEQLAARWLKEWQNGIAHTGVRPGFIKLGVGVGPLKPVEQKLIRAAAIVHLKSGLKIAIHTGDAAAAIEYTNLVMLSGIRPDAVIWVHAQNDDGQFHVQLAKKGCFVSLDGFKESVIDSYIKYVLQLKSAGLLNKVLLSQDDGFSVEKQGDQISFKPYNTKLLSPYSAIFTVLRPALLKNGISSKEFDMITQDNPKNAFMVEVCKLN